MTDTSPLSDELLLRLLDTMNARIEALEEKVASLRAEPSAEPEPAWKGGS